VHLAPSDRQTVAALALELLRATSLGRQLDLCHVLAAGRLFS